ncbi:putative exported protein precursor [Candidatus Rhodobacter oscarellae]|uniref:Putative exported protein n=1 Tax=Candidatus Rhodobacter oscarellae TaxID=1675527 RepID=A0A0J9EF26_9RHOB|nr:putative exported protein precursor [Candidatus Rhodobacter lobularis]
MSEGAPREINFTRSVSYQVDPRGDFAVEHAYVQYFVPEARNDEPPVVLVHGGGMSGSCWETTPDGRPGWLQLLLKRGYEVHVVDAVERGRAGFAPGHWQGEPLLRSLQEAWTLFRIGPRDGFASRTPFKGQRFPVDHFETLAQRFVPRWLTTTQLQTEALLAVLERTGPAIVICHSQGGEVTFDALASNSENIARVIALEPSGVPKTPEDLNGTPFTLAVGDFLDCDPFWEARLRAWSQFAGLVGARLLGPGEFGAGSCHLLMSDHNSDDVLSAVLQR